MSIILNHLRKTVASKHFSIKNFFISLSKTSKEAPTIKMSQLRNLAAFDFDNTIVVDNSDTVVQKLLPAESVPKYVRNGWTKYMSNIFELLHRNGIDKSAIEKIVSTIEPINGMCELIRDLAQNLKFDVIIISDANSYFINSWLAEHKLTNDILKVFTNPAEFVDGLLKIDMYHVQDWCKLSEKNLCKGHVLDEFIKSQRSAGVIYHRVIYIGDGRNDFCPILRLRPGDLAFCRKGFKCAKLVDDARNKKLIGDELYDVQASVHLWTTGVDVLKAIKHEMR